MIHESPELHSCIMPTLQGWYTPKGSATYMNAALASRLARAAFMHHDTNGHNALKHHMRPLKGYPYPATFYRSVYSTFIKMHGICLPASTTTITSWFILDWSDGWYHHNQWLCIVLFWGYFFQNACNLLKPWDLVYLTDYLTKSVHLAPSFFKIEENQ